jgi:ABC-2 type transport system permease protein
LIVMKASNTFTALKALIRKDLVLYFSNRRALVMSIAAPIVIAAFFGSLFASGGGKTSRIPVALSDLDGSAISKQIDAALRGDSALDVRELDATQAVAAVRTGDVRAAIVLPKGFGAAAPPAMFGGGDKPVIELHYDPSQSVVLAMVRGLLAQHVMDSVSQAVFSGNSLGGGSDWMRDLRRDAESSTGMQADAQRDLLAMFDSIDRFQRRTGGLGAGAAGSATSASASASGGAGRGVFSLPFETVATEATAAGTERPYNGYAHSFAGMGVQFILFMGIEVGVGMLLARRLGLWKRLRAAPLSRTLLLGSHILSGAITAMVLLAIIFAAAILFFHVRIEGSVAGFVGVGIAFALLTSSFGLLIAALGKTPEATRGLAIFATLVMVMLGGAWVPSFIFPEWLQTASLIVPTRWAVDGLDAMTWRGLGFHAAIAPIVVLLAFSALFAAIAIWRFDWEEPRG